MPLLVLLLFPTMYATQGQDIGLSAKILPTLVPKVMIMVSPRGSGPPFGSLWVQCGPTVSPGSIVEAFWLSFGDRFEPTIDESGCCVSIFLLGSRVRWILEWFGLCF